MMTFHFLKIKKAAVERVGCELLVKLSYGILSTNEDWTKIEEDKTSKKKKESEKNGDNFEPSIKTEYELFYEDLTYLDTNNAYFAFIIKLNSG